jgi:hypothetical protein
MMKHKFALLMLLVLLILLWLSTLTVSADPTSSSGMIWAG